MQKPASLARGETVTHAGGPRGGGFPPGDRVVWQLTGSWKCGIAWRRSPCRSAWEMFLPKGNCAATTAKTGDGVLRSTTYCIQFAGYGAFNRRLCLPSYEHGRL